MNALSIQSAILAMFSLSVLSACENVVRGEETPEAHETAHRIVVTAPVAKDVISTQQYVCQIHSRRHIEVRALNSGYLETIKINEGQRVKEGEVLFKILPILYQTALDTEVAEAELAQIGYNNTELLTKSSVVSDQQLLMAKAELARAKAKVARARAELSFTDIKAPFAGIVDRQHEQLGSLVSEGDILSTLSDNSVMWVYFNVPEARYLEYKANEDADVDIELKLANGKVFDHPGEIGAIEADFNNETGNIAFRADFPNPAGLLRHGQTGTILMHRKLAGAIVIPQRATYEILAKKYVFVIEPMADQAAEHEEEGRDSHHAGDEVAEMPAPRRGIVRQREIVIQEELEDIYVIQKGLSPSDKIIFEGIRQVRDGDEVEYDFESPAKILGNLKHHAE